VDPKWLLEMIDLTSFSVSSDETRYNLNGVFFEPSAGTLRTVATDGHRLSLAEVTVRRQDLTRFVGAEIGLATIAPL